MNAAGTVLDGRDIFLGRQPILDRGRNLRAFELLFRSGARNRADVGCATASTATVIHYALNELGIESVLGRYRGFINLDAEMLLSDSIELLPRDKVVLEILETVVPTARIVERCRLLRDLGFTLALDDFAGDDAALRPLLEVAHIVKVDLTLLEPDELAKAVARLRPLKMQLLAEKVDSAAQFRHCLDLGFDLFQGYHFARPEIITGRQFSRSELALTRLLGLLMTDANTPEIEDAFKQSPGLSVGLLRLVNSVAAGTGGRVTSLASAIVVLGRRQLQRWLQLLMFAQPAADGDFPSPLLNLAATRGKLLELMAAGNAALEDDAYMAGILSMTDALLGMPLRRIVAQLPVSDEVRDALLERSGTLGRMLDLAQALEGGDESATAAAIAALPELTPTQVGRAQAQALAWANSIAQPGAG